MSVSGYQDSYRVMLGRTVGGAKIYRSFGSEAPARALCDRVLLGRDASQSDVKCWVVNDQGEATYGECPVELAPVPTHLGRPTKRPQPLRQD
jgi:hypothetical protein